MQLHKSAPQGEQVFLYQPSAPSIRISLTTLAFKIVSYTTSERHVPSKSGLYLYTGLLQATIIVVAEMSRNKVKMIDFIVSD
jgi:hypothetical protein